MAPRKGTIATKMRSKRTGTSKTETGSAAPTIGAGFGSNGSPAVVPPNGVATHAQIEFRAYEIYLARGGADGDDLADWFKAERDLNG